MKTKTQIVYTDSEVFTPLIFFPEFGCEPLVDYRIHLVN